MINRFIDRLLDRLFPGLARRDRMICKLIERKRGSRAHRDQVTAELRFGTARMFRALCKERASYIGGSGSAHLVDGLHSELLNGGRVSKSA